MRKFSIIVAAAVAAAAPYAYADVSASATGSNFRYELSDLDTSDGIAATLSFNSQALYNANAAAVVELAGVSNTQLQTSPSSFGPVSAANVNSQSSSTATISGSGTLDSVVLHAEGSSRRAAERTSFTSVSTLFRPDVAGDPPFDSFTLAPNTMVHFTLDTALKASSTSFSETASALAYFDIFDASGRSYGQSLSIAVESLKSDTASGALDIFVANFGGESKSYYANLGLEAVGSVLSPVPEPGTYALMLAGLGMVGWAARRRAVKQATDASPA